MDDIDDFETYWANYVQQEQQREIEFKVCKKFLLGHAVYISYAESVKHIGSHNSSVILFSFHLKCMNLTKTPLLQFKIIKTI